MLISTLSTFFSLFRRLQDSKALIKIDITCSESLCEKVVVRPLFLPAKKRQIDEVAQRIEAELYSSLEIAIGPR